MKPIILITPLFDEERESLWMLSAYLELVDAAGGIPVISSFQGDESDAHRLVSVCDGILFTGGPDVEPTLYGEARLPSCGISQFRRDRLEKLLLDDILPSGKPIMGICRGEQFINAALGGTLYQDILTQRPTTINHHRHDARGEYVHEVNVLKDTLLYEILGKERLKVNSLHHQAVRECAPVLRPAAFSEDGFIEAVYMPGHPFCLGVQWHPELLFTCDPVQLSLIQAFIRASLPRTLR